MDFNAKICLRGSLFRKVAKQVGKITGEAKQQQQQQQHSLAFINYKSSEWDAWLKPRMRVCGPSQR